MNRAWQPRSFSARCLRAVRPQVGNLNRVRPEVGLALRVAKGSGRQVLTLTLFHLVPGQCGQEQRQSRNFEALQLQWLRMRLFALGPPATRHLENECQPNSGRHRSLLIADWSLMTGHRPLRSSAPFAISALNVPAFPILRPVPLGLRLVYGSFFEGPFKMPSNFANSFSATSIANVNIKGFTDQK